MVFFSTAMTESENNRVMTLSTTLLKAVFLTKMYILEHMVSEKVGSCHSHERKMMMLHSQSLEGTGHRPSHHQLKFQCTRRLEFGLEVACLVV